MLLQAASGMPPICFLSGLSGEELMMVVRAFPEAGTILAFFWCICGQDDLENLLI